MKKESIRQTSYHPKIRIALSKLKPKELIMIAQTNKNGEELRTSQQLKKQVADRYFSERIIAVLPALRSASEELNLTRSEILLLLSAKTYQRKHSVPFSAKSIEDYSYISHKNMNAALTNLHEKGYLKLVQRGGRFTHSSLFMLSYEGLQIINRFDDLVMDFNLKLSQ